MPVDKNKAYEFHLLNWVVKRSGKFWIEGDDRRGPFETEEKALNCICEYCGKLCPIQETVCGIDAGCSAYLDNGK